MTAELEISMRGAALGSATLNQLPSPLPPSLPIFPSPPLPRPHVELPDVCCGRLLLLF